MKTKKSRIIIFVVTLIYNLLLGLYLKEFIVLSQTSTAFYLLSAFQAFFMLIETQSRAMRTTVYVVLVLDILMNLLYFGYCRRLLPIMTILLLITELMYFITSTNQLRKDKLLTKICVSAITGLILVTGICFSHFSFFQIFSLSLVRSVILS